MAVREGKWRCPYCSVVNRGADMACTGCGATRDKDVSFFLEDDAPEVVDEALLKRAAAGADWLCQFCQTSNHADAPRCRQCGAERGTSPSRPVADVQKKALVSPPPATSGAGRGCVKWLLVLALLFTACCSVLCYFALRKTQDRVTVSGFEWTRTIDVEAYRTQRQDDWADRVPSDARVLSHHREVRSTEHEQVGTRRVKVGTRDKGNGFFEDVYEDQPVYRDHDVYGDKVTYEVQRWVKARAPSLSGQDRSPRWPDPGLGSGEREASRHETYVIVLKGAHGTYRMEAPQDRWAAMEPGQSFEATIQGGTKVLELK